MACGHCADCGTGLERNGVCPNCHEEAFIEDWQGEDIDWPLSDDWMRAASTQRDAAEQNVSELAATQKGTNQDA